ncbi:MAG: hypothetical protein Tsb0014_05940 [Pleurocapsa sp.]
MNEPPNRDALLVEFDKERSIRRTVKLLRAKRSRIREDLHQLLSHLALLVPISQATSNKQKASLEILVEAAQRLDDDLFTELLVQIIQEKDNRPLA